LGAAFVLLIAEHLAVSFLGLQKGNDCYIMLISVCYTVFDWILHAKPLELQGRCGLLSFAVGRSGNISTIIYVSHASVITVLSFVMKNILKADFASIEWCIFFITIIVCLSICCVFFALERAKPFSWLKYSH
jgi:hypothetical protein